MRHTKAEDLVSITALIIDIQGIEGIKEKRPMHFYFGGKSVIHFHVDFDGSLYADIGDKDVPVNGRKGSS